MVKLWTLRLERPLTAAESGALLRCLPSERRERLERVSRADRRREPLCAYALLALALEETCGWRELPAVETAERGKPFFPEYPEICFSLSHTDGAVLIGLSDRDIGVDLERIRPVGERLCRRITGGTDQAVFFPLWVRREARAKRSGAGIGAAKGPEPPLAAGEFYYSLETFPGYAAGVACGDAVHPGKPWGVRLEELLERQGIRRDGART